MLRLALNLLPDPQNRIIPMRFVARIFSAMLLCVSTVTAAAQVTISEFMAGNSQTLADQDGEYSDWIELFNSSAAGVNLENWTLTDSASQPAKWRFPAVTIAPRGFLVVFASGKNRA